MSQNDKTYEYTWADMLGPIEESDLMKNTPTPAAEENTEEDRCMRENPDADDLYQCLQCGRELHPCDRSWYSTEIGDTYCTGHSAPEETQPLTCRDCGSDDWSIGASGLCRTCAIQAGSAIVARLRVKALGFASAALLALNITTASAASLPAFVTNVPEGCAVTRVFEDHSALGVCAGGYVIGAGQNMDWAIFAVEKTLHLTDAAGVVHDVPAYYR